MCFVTIKGLCSINNTAEEKIQNGYPIRFTIIILLKSMQFLPQNTRLLVIMTLCCMACTYKYRTFEIHEASDIFDVTNLYENKDLKMDLGGWASETGYMSLFITAKLKEDTPFVLDSITVRIEEKSRDKLMFIPYDRRTININNQGAIHHFNAYKDIPIEVKSIHQKNTEIIFAVDYRSKNPVIDATTEGLSAYIVACYHLGGTKRHVERNVFLEGRTHRAIRSYK